MIVWDLLKYLGLLFDCKMLLRYIFFCHGLLVLNCFFFVSVTLVSLAWNFLPALIFTCVSVTQVSLAWVFYLR